MVDLTLNRVFENHKNLSGFLMLWPPFCPVFECHAKTGRICLVFECFGIQKPEVKKSGFRMAQNWTVRFSNPHCNFEDMFVHLLLMLVLAHVAMGPAWKGIDQLH
jgi:hypothetical protein